MGITHQARCRASRLLTAGEILLWEDPDVVKTRRRLVDSVYKAEDCVLMRVIETIGVQPSEDPETSQVDMLKTRRKAIDSIQKSDELTIIAATLAVDRRYIVKGSVR